MSNNIVEMPFCTRDEVVDEIRKIASEGTSRLLMLDHARMRMLERNISQRHVQRTLKNGDLISDIEWDTQKDKGWKCKFVRIVAGVRVTVVVKLIKKIDTKCLVVTVW